MSKGSSRRPQQVSREEFERRWERVFDRAAEKQFDRTWREEPNDTNNRGLVGIIDVYETAWHHWPPEPQPDGHPGGYDPETGA